MDTTSIAVTDGRQGTVDQASAPAAAPFRTSPTPGDFAGTLSPGRGWQYRSKDACPDYIGSTDRATAMLRAAAHHVCTHLLPVRDGERYETYAITLGHSVPALLEVRFTNGRGVGTISMQFPIGYENDAEYRITEIINHIRTLAPDETEDLPF